MLVITRRVNEKFCFPDLGITVELLRIAGQTARLGIQAPPHVKVLRHELAPGSASVEPTPKRDHRFANAVSRITLAIHLARKQWETGRTAEAEKTLQNALENLYKLEPPKSVPPAESSTPACRALIVEDDANERELLAGLLSMNGCECVTAEDGEDALAYLKSGQRPDVILLDMALPRCSGPETLRRIRSDSTLAGIRVFSVSSTSPRELNIPDGPDGFDAWFPKPLNPRQLWDAIRATKLVAEN